MAQSRRRLLVALGAIAVGAGCTGPPESTPTATPTDASGTVTANESADTSRDTPTASPDELDLREANVVGVEWDDDSGEVRFDVTLYHDDDGEEGYADWWQVETVDGEQLGRRELLHAHSTAPFTRSETIEVPADVPCVVVRGHDQTHGYGGQAMLVNLQSGETKAVDQGPEKQSFSAADCP